MDLFEDPPPAAPPGAVTGGVPGNQPEYTVSELSSAVKRVIEGEFGLVRVRAEVGRVSRPASGHVYFDLKDARSVIAAISWKGQVARMTISPEEGLEVVASGRMTTFPGQSKYQLIVEDIVPAGAGALMAMLEARRKALSAEGLFDASRKRPLPYLPQVIGVVTSPSGAVIRDILHRLRDRFPRHVLLWPVAVQGQDCPAQVAAAIRGFNILPIGGDIPRPDVLIVARGGGSLEDLWGFNDEDVVRAVAESAIPLISAVGHETDTTLIDYAADQRAPTPTAAAEMAVPVRRDLIAQIDRLAARMSSAQAQGVGYRVQRLQDVARALPRVESLLATPMQRLDGAGSRLLSALRVASSHKRERFSQAAAGFSARLLTSTINIRRDQMARLNEARDVYFAREQERAHARLDKWASRLVPALVRLRQEATRQWTQDQHRLGQLDQRLEGAMITYLRAAQTPLAALERTRQTLGYTQTLRRGFAVVRDAENGAVLTNTQKANTSKKGIEVQFHDGRTGPFIKA